MKCSLLHVNFYRRSQRIIAGALLGLFVFTSFVPTAYGAESPCGAGIPAYQCPCPTTMNSLDCTSIIGPWPAWKPDTGAGACATGGSSIELVGADNQAKIMNFFVGKGFKPYQAAGAVGNLLWESGGALDPKALEAKGSGRPGYTGHGIVQWSWERWRTDYGASKDAMRTPNAARQSDLTDFAPYPPKPPLDPNSLLGFAAEKKTNWYDLGTQVEFMLKEISPGGNRGGILEEMKNSPSIDKATEIWFYKYESPGDGTLGNRKTLANKALQMYGGTDSSIPGSTTTPTSDASTGGCGGAVSCTGGGAATAGLSQTRQNVVCLAQKELAAWTPIPTQVPRLGYYKYSDNSPEAWCADFVSWIYKEAGYPFTGGTSGGWRLPAVVQVKGIGEKNEKFHWHSASSYTPKPGDVAVHLNDATGVSHVNLVTAVSGTTVTLIGGNQGPAPWGGTNSASVVSQVTQSGFASSDTIGYVSPD